MTVIAFKDGILAADSTICIAGTYYGRVEKIKKFSYNNKIVLAAAAGASNLCVQFITQIEKIYKETFGAFSPEKIDLLIADQNDELDGTIVIGKPVEENLECTTHNRYAISIYSYDESGICDKMLNKSFTSGRGREIALGAMEAGASAVEAVQIAIKYCNSCAGSVDVLRFD